MSNHYTRASVGHRRVMLWQAKMLELIDNAPRPTGRIAYGIKARRATKAIADATAALLDFWPQPTQTTWLQRPPSK